MISELEKRVRNWSRTVLSNPIVSGERPTDLQPSQAGSKSRNGISLPCITSGAVLKLVVMTQKIGNSATIVHRMSRPVDHDAAGPPLGLVVEVGLAVTEDGLRHE